jgi:hypothetical protein
MTEPKWMPGERKSWMSEEETAGLFQEIRDGLDEIDDELEYLKWFKQNADFGPADSDVHAIMDEQYTLETGKPVPTDWAQEGE